MGFLAFHWLNNNTWQLWDGLLILRGRLVSVFFCIYIMNLNAYDIVRYCGFNVIFLSIRILVIIISLSLLAQVYTYYTDLLTE